MSTKKKLLEAAAGNAGEAVYVDDMFSTYLYTGTAATLSINNGIDLDGEGGLVWIKQRNTSDNHLLIDTERGATKTIFSNSTFQEVTYSTGLTSFNNNGFTLGTESSHNSSGINRVAWTFRKQPGFFDVVTYSGDGNGSTAISHNLGSVPGMMIIKRTNTSGDWAVYHRAVASNPVGYKMKLNDSSARNYNTSYFPTLPTSTVFYPGSDADVNGSGNTYVAYLFAHDAQDFGTDSDEAIIKCGSYTGNGTSSSSTQHIDLGFEPQFFLVKTSTMSGQEWFLVDTMRGFVNNGNDSNDLRLMPSTTDSEFGYQVGHPTATGIQLNGNENETNKNGETYIYMAIARPHKPASELAATDLFDVGGYTGTAGTLDPAIEFPFDTDMFMLKRTDASGDMNVFSRLVEYPTTGGNVALSALVTSSTAAESDTYTFRSSDAKDIVIAQDGADNLNVSGGTYIYYGLRRAPGFFDVVAYTGTGGSTNTINHNLGVVPEMMWVKRRDASDVWWVYHKDMTGTPHNAYMRLDTDAAVVTNNDAGFGNVAPTATQFTVGGFPATSSSENIAYLFATVPGISKLGTYTGTGNSVLTIDCGFSSSARFVIIKRTDSTSFGDWFVFDSVRGIVAGNDPFMYLNSTSAQNSSYDWIDPDSSGFSLPASGQGPNVNGASYIFLAIA